MLFVILVLVRCTATWKLFVNLFAEIKIYIAIYINIRQDMFYFLAFFGIIYEALIVRREKDKWKWFIL